jgi:ribosomal protein S18 acetylase RimI-like enzyme
MPPTGKQRLQIRPYEPATDQARVLDIWLAASRAGHPFLTEADLATQRMLVRDLYLEQAETWVATMAGRIEGFIGLLDAFIGGLFVDPEAHRSGIGRALVQHAAARKGALTVDVYAANEAALAFYARLGFTLTGRRDIDDEGRHLPLLQLRRPAR